MDCHLDTGKKSECGAQLEIGASVGGHMQNPFRPMPWGRAVSLRPCGVPLSLTTCRDTHSATFPDIQIHRGGSEGA
jgi:hypothetical protein